MCVCVCVGCVCGVCVWGGVCVCVYTYMALLRNSVVTASKGGNRRQRYKTN